MPRSSAPPSRWAAPIASPSVRAWSPMSLPNSVRTTIRWVTSVISPRTSMRSPSVQRSANRAQSAMVAAYART
ncbi:hypothetical protein ACH4U6_15095 [Streptomyces netropsis]|uniref:hypothetical protein n=1 Tax=Streptomyces netropsis TaxID=55404 RepID=UPI00378EC0D6